MKLTCYLLAVSVMASGCGAPPSDKSKQATGPAPQKTQEVKESLSSADKQIMAEPFETREISVSGTKLLMDLPKDSEVDEGVKTTIKRGPYVLQIVRLAADLDREKEEAKRSEFHKYLGEVIDTEDVLAFKQEGYGGSVEYVFVYKTNIDGQDYRVENGAIAPRATSEEQMKWMLKSAETLRSAKTP